MSASQYKINLLDNFRRNFMCVCLHLNDQHKQSGTKNRIEEFQRHELFSICTRVSNSYIEFQMTPQEPIE